MWVVLTDCILMWCDAEVNSSHIAASIAGADYTQNMS